MSNRFQLVEREHIHGGIHGVWFGYNFRCIARSLNAALLWSAGTMYTSGRQSVYGESSLYLVGDRTNTRDWYRNAKEIDYGGRLNPNRIRALTEKLGEQFDAETIKAIVDAVDQRKTLLIEGGGEPFTPSNRVLRKKALSNVG
jgi:hypothetical protein